MTDHEAVRFELLTAERDKLKAINDELVTAFQALITADKDQSLEDYMFENAIVAIAHAKEAA